MVIAGLDKRVCRTVVLGAGAAPCIEIIRSQHREYRDALVPDILPDGQAMAMATKSALSI